MMIMGVFFAEAYYYPFTASLFPWPFSFQLQLLSPLVGSVAGACLGNRFFLRSPQRYRVKLPLCESVLLVLGYKYPRCHI